MTMASPNNVTAMAIASSERPRCAFGVMVGCIRGAGKHLTTLVSGAPSLAFKRKQGRYRRVHCTSQVRRIPPDVSHNISQLFPHFIAKAKHTAPLWDTKYLLVIPSIHKL